LAGTSAANQIKPTSGLATIEINGEWININTGTSQQQIIQIPYTDFIPCIWVETYSGSSDYEIWFNSNATYGQSLTYYRENYESTGFDSVRGRYFMQVEKPEPYPINSGLSYHFTNNIILGLSGATVPIGANIRIPNIING